MNNPRYSQAVQRGFSLPELIVAMGIAMVLMGALAAIFASSITTREKIDRDGQKIETARYSLDTLAEDIRLAGYYGTLAPSLPGLTLANGATPADWVYVDPCSTATGALPGWDSTGIAAITAPMAIFGYEMHGAGDLPPSALLACIGAYNPATNVSLTGAPVAGTPPTGGAYKRGTDVLVIRRVSTTPLTAGGTGYVDGDPYLQVSTCPEGAVDPLPPQPPPFIAKATATSADFNMHLLGCTPTVAGPLAPVRKLITRIYFIAQCDDCFNNLDNNTATMGDGIPTLKMVELGMSGGALSMIKNVRTIAPGVENMHFEYGIDTTDDGSIDAWVESNDDPRQTGSTGDAVAGMRLDANTENRWEDVTAVKLFMLTRDLLPTAGYTDTRSFVMGSRTIGAAGDTFRRRQMSSTVKLVNMAGRREAP